MPEAFDFDVYIDDLQMAFDTLIGVVDEADIPDVAEDALHRLRLEIGVAVLGVTRLVGQFHGNDEFMEHTDQAIAQLELALEQLQ